MAKKRVPKVGDRVDAIGHHGAFVVSEINAKRQTAKLTRFGNPGLILNVGWHHIGFLDDQDASQAAARIVREATEDR
jgi:hypothetical protein